jgi:putative transposase
MKKRFSEEQIIGFLREAEAGLAVKDLCRRHGFFGGELLPVEVEVWRDVGAGCKEAEAPRDGEHAAEEAAG